MRSVSQNPLLVLALCGVAFAPAACADAPITPAHLDEEGHLRANVEQKLFRAPQRAPETQKAEPLQLTAVLASQSEGALEDSTRFVLGEVESVNLHLRADHLGEPRPVTFVWTHGEDRFETMGFLSTSPTLSLATSRPVVEETDLGPWKVEVHGAGPFGATLYERSFEVVVAEDEERKG